MIYHFIPRLLTGGGHPPMLVNEGAQLPCKCVVAVGMRTDTKEVASAAIPCSPDHTQLMEHFNLRLRESLVERQDRPLVEVADELLRSSARFYGIADE